MLPSIPVSPLIQQSLNCASQLAEFTKKIADQQKDDVDYYEQQSIAQRIKLDLITKQMHSVRDLLYHHWQPEALAKQIVIINVDLFLHHQVKQLNDFHTYLLHSLAHQIIISNSHSYATAFDFAIRLARCLHQYRDWNGCMAVLRCLSLPPLKRLYYSTTTTTSHPLIHDFPWMQQDIDSSYLQAFQQSLLPLRPYSLEAHEHKRTRSLSTSSFHSKKKKKTTYVISIPWFPPILDLVSEQDREILMDICRYNHWPKQPSITRALFNLSDNDNNNMNSSPLKNIPPMLPSSSIFDLATSLGQGDLLICHWLLSRAFLTLDQLDSESEIIKPTSNNEIQHQQHQQQLSDNGIIMDNVDNEEVEEVEEDEIAIVEEIEQLHVDNPIEVMEIEEDREVNVNIALLSSKSSLKSNYNNNDENNTIQQDDNDDKNEIKSENTANTTNIPTASHSPSTSIHSVDFTNLRTIQQGNIVSDSTSKLDSIKDNNDNSINDNRLQLEQQYHLLNNNNDTDTSSVVGNTSEQINENSMDESKIQTDKSIDMSPFNSATLSKTIDNNIPIFDNSNQLLKEDSHNHIKSIHADSSIENSIDKMENNNSNGKVDDMMEIKSENNYSIKESNTIHQNGVMEVVEEEKRNKKENDNEDDDASEQWTGYPIPKEDTENSNQDYDMEEEDEVWTGYPEPHQHGEHQYHHHNKTISSDEASEEEWKGYHATSEEAKWQEETILKVQQQEWQGYALETLDEDELDSSTVITNRYEKTYQSGNIILNHPIHSSPS
ncbi:hypothetical protein BJ944DRAFT_260904 [Cunninghamella echinulata]|nr:hypothetical protein BJ944DRAFT_260904 [Cunninghamella echinulata]